jgi:hypothetical protein
MATTSDRTAELPALLTRSFEALVAELAEGRSERLERYLRFTARFYRYSPQNQALIFEQMPEATRVAGYRTWQKLGYQVYCFLPSAASEVPHIVTCAVRLPLRLLAACNAHLHKITLRFNGPLERASSLDVLPAVCYGQPTCLEESRVWKLNGLLTGPLYAGWCATTRTGHRQNWQVP